jgi:2-polyprenyl-3-methyl-5-hydroxy-6-metoxy-1,4-benzoquinol methylase
MDKYYYGINLGILKQIGSGNRILDVGCGAGLMGQEMKKKKNYVFGIDKSQAQLKVASTMVDKVKYVDITAPELDLPPDFDKIVFADILEHLVDPQSCLTKFKDHLKKDGRIIISIPNIACYNIRFNIMLGNFDYKDYGVCDNTHLRFFTKKSAVKLVKDAGYKITKLDTTPYFAFQIFNLYKKLFLKEKKDNSLIHDVFKSRTYGIYRKYLFPFENFVVKLWPGLFAYQFIIVAEK